MIKYLSTYPEPFSEPLCALFGDEASNYSRSNILNRRGIINISLYYIMCQENKSNKDSTMSVEDQLQKAVKMSMEVVNDPKFQWVLGISVVGYVAFNGYDATHIVRLGAAEFAGFYAYAYFNQ